MRVLKLCLTFALCMGLMVSFTPKSYADATSEAILKLLIKKGIITQQEVDSIKSEVAKQEVQVPTTIEARVAKLEKDVPSWIKNIKLKGDFRLRQENIWKEQPAGEDNERQRIRLRVGLESKLNDQLKVALGIATGSSDTPTSTNQTLEQEFQSKNIWLDYAFAEYKPTGWATFWGGKFKSPFFHTDMLWDSDIRMDGFAAKLTHTVWGDSDLPETQLYLTGGYFPIDDINNDMPGDSDLFLTIGQIGTVTKFEDVAKLKTGIAYYNFNKLEGYKASISGVTSGLEESKATNTRTGAYIANDFRVLSPNFKLTFNNPFDIGFPISLIGEFADNTSVSKHGSAWRAGFELGKKVKKKGDWRFLAQYSRLEADSFYDGFPDADFNSGGTNAKGYEIIIDYALFKNVILSLDYYNTQKVSGFTESTSESDEQVLQADVIFKF